MRKYNKAHGNFRKYHKKQSSRLCSLNSVVEDKLEIGVEILGDGDSLKIGDSRKLNECYFNDFETMKNIKCIPM